MGTVLPCQQADFGKTCSSKHHEDTNHSSNLFFEIFPRQAFKKLHCSGLSSKCELRWRCSNYIQMEPISGHKNFSLALNLPVLSADQQCQDHCHTIPIELSALVTQESEWTSKKLVHNEIRYLELTLNLNILCWKSLQTTTSRGFSFATTESQVIDLPSRVIKTCHKIIPPLVSFYEREKTKPEQKSLSTVRTQPPELANITFDGSLELGLPLYRFLLYRNILHL